ncbi:MULTISPECIES: hypothetical protein [Hymenobacter]|nr:MULTISPECIES: hypothetical protein [unclassified Hymenobacter]
MTISGKFSRSSTRIYHLTEDRTYVINTTHAHLNRLNKLQC